MNIRNLIINDKNIDNHEEIVDAIRELEIVISNNYQNVKEEIGIEFNIGSRLGEPKEYLVVYVNPEYKNNPYVFVLKNFNENKLLCKETSISSFRDLADKDVRKEVNKAIYVGFKRLPKYAFLGIKDIQSARDMAKETDDLLK